MSNTLNNVIANLTLNEDDDIHTIARSIRTNAQRPRDFRDVSREQAHERLRDPALLQAHVRFVTRVIDRELFTAPRLNGRIVLSSFFAVAGHRDSFYSEESYLAAVAFADAYGRALDEAANGNELDDRAELTRLLNRYIEILRADGVKLIQDLQNRISTLENNK
jgi:hypothetical protein